MCPACNEVVTAQSGDLTPQPQARARRTRGPEGPPVCPGCGGRRDRAGTRCGRCGADWFYRAVATPQDEDSRERLVEYVLRRQVKAETREQIAARFAGGRGVVLDRITETQALRVRQEVEAFGAMADVERDQDAVVHKLRGAPSPARVAALAIVALGVLALGVWSVLPEPAPEPEQPPPATRAKTRAPRKATPAPARSEPEDALEAVVVTDGSPGRPAFFVDVDGWLLGPTALGVGASIEFGDEKLPATPVTQAAGLGVSLFRVKGRAPLALPLGDASKLKAGTVVFVADPFAGALVRTAVAHPDHALGRLVYIRLRDPLDARLDGAPVLDQRGLVVGIYLRGVSQKAGSTLALPVNLLNEGEGALLSIILPKRDPSPRMAEWLASAAAADRQSRPALYEVVDRGLLTTVSCPGVTCSGRVGILSPGGSGSPPGRLEARFLGIDQRDDATPAFGVSTGVRLGGGWQATPLGPAEPLLGSLPRGIRARLLAAEVSDLRLLATTYEVERPMAVAGQAFRLMLVSEPRRSVPLTVGAQSPQVPGRPDDVGDR